MPILKLDQLTIAYGATNILSGLSFQLEAGRRLAVVGANGSGKSSLLRAIAGELSPAAGTITLSPRSRLAHLPQELEAGPHETVYEDALHSRADIMALRAELRRLEDAIASADPPETSAVLERYGDAQHEYERLDGYAYDSRVAEVLHGVGLSQNERRLPPTALSGGQRRRLALARLLLQEADLLLLDEPTNYLDLEAIEWLEAFLSHARAGMLIVSHDRRFLDRVSDDVLELQGGSAEWYPGNYTDYLKLRQERRARRQKEYEEQQQFIARTEEFIRRYRAGQRAREARGRQTRLDRLERVARPPEDRQIRIRLKATETSQQVFHSEGLEIGYDDHRLLTVPALTIEAQDRVAIVGPNGSGKTTLLKVLLGELTPLKGRVKRGTRVHLRYYDQHLADLDPTKTVLEELQDASGLPEETLRRFAGRLLFSGDDAFKAIRSLSGGEKSRVALAKLMLDDAGALLLDEPTNHLDIPSQEMLEEALTAYDGTVVFVSHDRYFIDAIATRIWSIEDGIVLMHLGNYSDLEGWRRRPAPSPSKLASRAPRHWRTSPASPQSLSESVLTKLEAQIAELEAEVRQIENKLADHQTYDDPSEVAALSQSHQEMSSRLERLYEDWERSAQEAGQA